MACNNWRPRSPVSPSWATRTGGPGADVHQAPRTPGARVIKVENPAGGDFARHYDDVGQRPWRSLRAHFVGELQQGVGRALTSRPRRASTSSTGCSTARRAGVQPGTGSTVRLGIRPTNPGIATR